MAESDIVYTNRNGSMSITDGTNTYTVVFEAGDLSVDIPRESLTSIKNRGKFVQGGPQIRKVEDQPMTASFTAWFRDLGDATEATLLDFLTDSGFVAASWTPTNGATAEVPTWTVTYTLDNTGGAEAATISLPYSVLRGSITESGEGSTVTVNIESHAVLPIIT